MAARRAHILVLVVSACLLQACGDGQTISVKLYAAKLDEQPTADPPAGWRRVEYKGGQRAGKGIYLVAEKPVITEWNLLAIKTGSQPDGSIVVTARLNAYSMGKLSEHTANAAGQRRLLALDVDGRWADFSPILNQVKDRISLFGFTPDQASRLEKYLETR